MKVVVRLFAGVRERAGTGSLELELPAGATSADVWLALGLGPEPEGLRYAVNKSLVGAATALAEGDEVAVIPPVSGGDFRLSEQPLDVNAVVREVERNEAGAVATFIGTTRRHSRGRHVLYLDYEAYPDMAEKMMAELADGLKSRYDILDVAIHHRIGKVGIGEMSVVIAVSAAHRADALAACKDAIDELKESIPLWKKEVYDGGEEWIGEGS